MSDTTTCVKIFYGFGWSGLERMEDEINTWLDENCDFEIISVMPQMCTVGSSDEMYQSMSVLIHYK